MILFRKIAWWAFVIPTTIYILYNLVISFEKAMGQ
jgi:hypothetical protein